MTEEKLLQEAGLIGFDHFKILDTKQILFDPALRRYCEVNYCGNYGQNYSCPPESGTPEELEKKAGKFQRALVLQTVTEIQDILNSEETGKIKKHHNRMTLELAEKMEKDYLLAMAGPCALCTPCAMKEGKPCHFPKKKASCLSAYCIQVEKLARVCEMPYWCEGAVAFFSLIFFN